MADLQRARMLAGMAAACRERGSGRVTVADVVTLAGVSRRTFYELFEDREECLMASVEEGLRRAAGQVLPAYRTQEGWWEAVRGGLEAFLFFLDEDRLFGGLLVLDVPAAGERALARRAEVVSALAREIDRGRAFARSPKSVPACAGEAAVEGVLGMLASRLAAKPKAPVRGIAGELAAVIVLPYLGSAAAAREARRRPAPRAVRRFGGGGDVMAGLNTRMTYRTVRVLGALAENPGASNRQVAEAAGITDQGQISKLLARLAGHGLIVNGRRPKGSGEANTWKLTGKGAEVELACRRQT